MQEHFTPEQRLEIVSRGDPWRKWKSLDDKRVWAVCDRVFNGSEVTISRDQRGRYLLHCPTEECPSYVAQWFCAGNATASAA